MSPRGGGPIYIWETWMRYFSPIHLGEDKISDVDLKHQLQYWYRMVNGFSTREITCQDDIFSTTSGVAKEIQRLITQEYKAGLWAGDMHIGLLWSDSSRELALKARILHHRGAGLVPAPILWKQRNRVGPNLAVMRSTIPG